MAVAVVVVTICSVLAAGGVIYGIGYLKGYRSATEAGEIQAKYLRDKYMALAEKYGE